MPAPNDPGRTTKYTEQYIQNYGFDDANKLPVVEIVGVDPTGAVRRVPTNAYGNLVTTAGLSIPAHNYISLSYTGNNLTGVVYKQGGSGGTTVGTLTLGYSGSNLVSVTLS